MVGRHKRHLRIWQVWYVQGHLRHSSSSVTGVRGERLETATFRTLRSCSNLGGVVSIFVSLIQYPRLNSNRSKRRNKWSPRYPLILPTSIIHTIWTIAVDKADSTNSNRSLHLRYWKQGLPTPYSMMDGQGPSWSKHFILEALSPNQTIQNHSDLPNHSPVHKKTWLKHIAWTQRITQLRILPAMNRDSEGSTGGETLDERRYGW
jgi:hypothetical protein